MIEHLNEKGIKPTNEKKKRAEVKTAKQKICCYVITYSLITPI